MRRLIWLFLAMLLLCGCSAEQAPEEVTEAATISVYQPPFYEGALEHAPLEVYPLEVLQEYFPYSSAVENQWDGVITDLAAYNYFDVTQDLPGGVLRQYTDGEGKTCRYTVYKVAEGGYFYVFWDALRINAKLRQQLPWEEAWSGNMLYVPQLRSKSDFDTLQVGVSTGADVTDIDPAGEFAFAGNKGYPSRHLLEDGSYIEILYEMADCGCTYTRDLLTVSSIICYDGAENPCLLAAIDPEDLPKNKS